MGSYVSVVNDVDDAALFVAFGYNEQALGYAIAGIQLAFAILSGLRSPGAYNPLSDILKAEGKAFFSIAKDSYTNGQRLEFTASAVNAYQAANGGFSANSLDEMAFALFTAYATGDKEFDKDGTNIGGLDLHRGPRNIGKAQNGYFQDGEYSLSLVLQANTPAGQYNILGNICAPCPGNLLVATCDNFGVTTSCYYGSVLGLKTPGVCDCPNNQYVTSAFTSHLSLIVWIRRRSDMITNAAPHPAQSPNYPIFTTPVTPRCASCLDVGVATCTGHLFPTTCKPNYHLDSGSGLQVGAASVRCCFENQFSADDGFGAGATYADGTYVPGYYQEQFGQDRCAVQSGHTLSH
ncbi:hypothetical protein RQP46_007626 [Phenoliferia psychrophenolica]